MNARFRGADNTIRTKEGHIEYLRICAKAWRAQPGDKLAKEQQALRNEAMADALEASIEASKDQEVTP